MEIYPDPNEICKYIRTDGSIKTYSYAINVKEDFPYGWRCLYIFIVYDEKNNKVIGWGKDFANFNIVRIWDKDFV